MISAELRHIARVAATLASAGEDEVRAEISAALAAGLDIDALHELILQSYLFVGYPRAINALVAFRSAAESAGLRAMPQPDPRAESIAAWSESGARLCRLVYGDRYDKLVANMRALHPDLARWMELEGYGKVLSRPHLDFRRRELAVLAILAATGMERQLRSHVQGARHAGASDAEIRAVIAEAARRLPDAQRPAIEALVESCLST